MHSYQRSKNRVLEIQIFFSNLGEKAQVQE